MIAAQPGVEVRSHRAWTWLLPPSAGVREPAALTLEVRGGRLSGRSAAPGSPTGEALVACPLNGAAVTVLRGAIFGAPSLRAGAALQFRLSAVDSAGVATHWPLLLRGGLVSWLRHPEEGCWTLDRDGLRRVLLAITTRDDAGSCYFATVVLRAERTLARPP